jgi:hypothetical protein
MIVGVGVQPVYPGLQPQAWVHVATTWDGTTVRLYVNGVLVTTTLAPNTLPSNMLDLRIGADSNGHNRFDGLLDELAVYDRTLSAAEIAAVASQ